ncbi:MAG: hypothetical protein CMP36_02905 [Rickettsiales bacterium]|nr:hypothetical protein [Rickettsiales bacterium]OUV79501.1 MAG: hypothetical protein CBC91_03590 [Rickettsiales bacterium TMED131]
MRIGAVLATSIFLVDEIIKKKIPAKLIIKNYIRKNKYIGSKDKKLLYEVVFSTLKKYYGLLEICSEYEISKKTKNLILFNICNKNKINNLNDYYEGKYSLIKECEDESVFKKAINHNCEIKPKLPDWIEKKLSITDNKKKNKFYKSILLEPRFDIAINFSKYSREIVKNKLNNYKIYCKDTEKSPYGLTIQERVPNNNLDKIKKDMFEVQDEGSQLMTLLTNIKPKMRILDLCAGKGTKTIFIKNMIENKGRIVAYDTIEERLAVLKKRTERLKLKNIKITTHLEPYSNYFDLIVCDVPCTGIGTWRRRPESIIWLNRKELERLKNEQYNILKKAAGLCKINGKIVYITCSLIYDENEEQICNFLSNHKNFRLAPISGNIKKYFSEKTLKNLKYGFTLFPDELDSDGYFISILKRTI